MRVRQVTALAATVAVLYGGVHAASAQQNSEAWRPVGNVEFVVGAGAGGRTIALLAPFNVR